MAPELWDFVEPIIILVPSMMMFTYCMSSFQLAEEDAESADADGAAAARSALHARPHPPAAVVVERRNAAPAAVKKTELGYFPYSAALKKGRGAGERLVCAICLEVLVEGATCSEVPACRHSFHRDCIELWMGNNVNSTCPLCRVPIVPGSETLSAAEAMV